MSDFGNLSPSASPVLTMDFTDRLGAKTIASATWTVLDDTDAPQASLLVGVADITAAPLVRQQVVNLVKGKVYLHRCIVTTVQSPTEKVVGELWQRCVEGA